MSLEWLFTTLGSNRTEFDGPKNGQKPVQRDYWQHESKDVTSPDATTLKVVLNVTIRTHEDIQQQGLSAAWNWCSLRCTFHNDWKLTTNGTRKSEKAVNDSCACLTMTTFIHHTLRLVHNDSNHTSLLTNNDVILLVCSTSRATLNYDSTELTKAKFGLSVHWHGCNNVNLQPGTSLTTSKFCHSGPVRVRKDNELTWTTYFEMIAFYIDVITCRTTQNYLNATALVTTAIH